MKPNHTWDCPHYADLSFNIRIPNEGGYQPDDVLRISDTGIKYERNYSNGNKWFDNYSIFKFCPLCGNKYEE